MVRIKCIFYIPHQPELYLVKNNIHICFLDKPDAMFPADSASKALHQFKQ